MNDSLSWYFITYGILSYSKYENIFFDLENINDPNYY